MENDTSQLVPTDQPTPPPAPHHPAHTHHTHQSAPAAAMIGQIKPPHQVETEDVDMSSRPKQPHTGRTVAAAVMGLVILGGLAATWYHLNTNVYSLNGHTSSIAQASPTPNAPATLGAETSQPQIASLAFTNLKPLSQGHYQAWLTHQKQVTSLGAFKIADDNSTQALDGSVFAPTVTITDSDQIQVSIEAGDNVSTTPSKSIILSGSVKQNQAKLSFKAIDLAKAAGTFILSTPTDPQADPKSGLWFAKTDGQNLTGPSLSLPTAPDGWKYEGQVVYKGVAVEIGRFSSPNQADEFNKFTTNPDKTPAFPGEDFLQKPPGQLGLSFPTDLTTGDWQVVISVEPDQGGTDPTGNDTFFIQPLKASIAQGSQPNKDYPLTLDLSTLPTGTVTFK